MSLSTQALSLQALWRAEGVLLNTAKRHIELDVICTVRHLSGPHCGVIHEGTHERVRRSWRHLNLFQSKAWLHAGIPRVTHSVCGKTSQVPVPCVHHDKGFTLQLEALPLCQLPVAHAARDLKGDAKYLWRRIAQYVNEVRARNDMGGVCRIGIDETDLRKIQEYRIAMRDLEQRRVLSIIEGRGCENLDAFVKDIKAHDDQAQAISHVRVVIGAAYLKGVLQQQPQPAIWHDRYHLAALASKSLEEVSGASFKAQPTVVAQVLGELDQSDRRSLSWHVRTHHAGWCKWHMQATYALRRTGLPSSSAWRLRVRLYEVYETAAQSRCEAVARPGLERWIGWARHRRLAPFKPMTSPLKTNFGGVIAGMQQGRSNAFVEAVIALLQNAKRAARGFRTSGVFISIPFLHLHNIKNLPTNPSEHDSPRYAGLTTHRC